MRFNPETLTIEPDFDIQEPEKKGELVPVIVKDPVTHRELTIDTYSVDARDGGSKSTVIVFQPWSDYVGRKFSQARMDLIAERMKARVIGVDNLGVGENTSRIPWHMRRNIAHGDFSAVSDLQWQAVQQNEAFDPDDDITLAYYSLGTSMASSMAANAPEGVTIDQMILWDCAAIESQSFVELAGKYLKHGPDGWKEYKEENPAWVPEMGKMASLVLRIMARPAGYISYPRGMARRVVGDDLRLAFNRRIIVPEHTTVHVINGSESKVSPTAANDRLAETLGGFPVKVQRIVLNGETHAVNDSLPRISVVFGGLALQSSNI